MVVLHYLEGHKQETVAQELGISQSAVSKRLAQGLDALRKKLAKAGVLVPGAALATMLVTGAAEAAPATLTPAVGKIALTGTVGGGAKAVGTTATIGGISMLKLGIASVAVAGVVSVGGFVVRDALRANPVAMPPQAVIVPQTAEKDAVQRFLTGKVFSPDGKPVAGARVRLYYSHDSMSTDSRWLSETESDDEGKFKINNPKFTASPLLLGGPLAKLRLVATHSGSGPGWTTVFQEADDGYSLMLTGGYAILGRVVDKDFRPVAGPQVAWMPVSADWNPDNLCRDPLGLATTDDNGGALFTDVGGEEIALTALKDGVMGSSLVDLKGLDEAPQAENAAPGRVLYLVGVSLTRVPMIVRGKVTCADTGKAAAGMLVTSSYYYYTCIATRTDAEGRFELNVYPEESRMIVFFRGPIEPFVSVYDPAPLPAYAAAHLQPNDFVPGKEVSLVMTPGKELTGTVMNSLSGKALPGAIVAVQSVFAKDHVVRHYRLADADGRYRLRVADEAVVLWVVQCPGYAVRPAGGMSRATRLEKVASSQTQDLTVEVVPAPLLDIAVVSADGKPSPVASVWVSQMGDVAEPKKADAAGMARIGGIVQGEPCLAYAVSADGTQAAVANIQVEKGQIHARAGLTLQPARVGTVELWDAAGKVARGDGRLLVWLSRGTTRCVTFRASRPVGDLVFKVPGLLPNEQYGVTGVRGQPIALTSDDAPIWRIDETDENPRLLLRLGQGGKVASAIPFPTARQFEAELASVKSAWKKSDPVQKSLTWCALKQGIAIADSEKKEVRRIAELLGETDFVANGIAFGKDKVWLGTSKGLFAWDRKDMFWTRFAVGGKFIDLPVNEVSLNDGGKLLVTVEKDQTTRRFEYDSRTATWKEL